MSLDHIVYDSFGNIVTETNATNGDRFKFAGMEYDSTTGQYYDRARFYDPATGRFVSQDPAGFAAGDANLYRYVGNDPTNEVDPSGLAPLPAPKFPPNNGLKPFPNDPRPLPPIWTPVPGSEDPDSGNPTEYTSNDPNGPNGNGPSAHWHGDSQPPHWDINYPVGSRKRTFKPGGDEIDPKQRHGPRNEVTCPEPVGVPNPNPSAPPPPPGGYPPNPPLSTLPWWVPANPNDDWKYNTGTVIGGSIVIGGTIAVAAPAAITSIATTAMGSMGTLIGIGSKVPVAVP